MGLSVPCDPDGLPRFLRRQGHLERSDLVVDRLPTGAIRLAFPSTSWLFRLEITLRYSDGRWSGAGSFEANATRLLANTGDRHDFSNIDEFHAAELSTSPAIRTAPETLDGKDNFVPNALLRVALNTDWCALAQVYLNSVFLAVHQVIGSVHEFNGTPQHTPLLLMPGPHQWVLREVEFYQEFEDDNAPMRVAEIAEIARGLTSEFGVDEHGPAIFGERRIENMPSMQLSLGRAGIHLSVYAKAFNRIRMEVRYKKYPIKACGLSRASYVNANTWFCDMLRDIQRDAVRRLDLFMSGYRSQRGGDPGSLVSLAICLPKIAEACLGEENYSYKILSLLIMNGALTGAGDARMQRVIDRLVESRVLHQVRTSPRSSTRDYPLTPRFRRSLQRLRPLMMPPRS